MNLKIKKHHELPSRGAARSEIVFHVVCKLDLSDEEQTLVDRYVGGEHIVATLETARTGEPRIVRLLALQKGYSASARSPDLLSDLIERVTQGCEALSKSLADMHGWHGETEILIPETNGSEEEPAEPED